MRPRAITEPSAGLTEASSSPVGFSIQAPWHAPELTGSIASVSRISETFIIRLRKPGESLRPGSETPAGGLSPFPHSLDDLALKLGIVPMFITAHLADPVRARARGGAGLLGGPNVKGIAYQVAIRG